MTALRPDLSAEVRKRREIILRELRRRSLWFIQLRWLVPPSIAAGCALAWLLHVEFDPAPVVAAAGWILLYNIVLFTLYRSMRERGEWRSLAIMRFTHLQVGLDYSAMLLLIHFTGGAASPFIFFFIFHVIFAAILLPARSAYGFAALAAVGMATVATAEYLHWVPGHPIRFLGQGIDLAEQPFHVFVELSFFTASVFITAYSTTSIMPGFRARIDNLSGLSTAVISLNNRLNALYEFTRSISSVNRFEQVLEIVTSELCEVMKVRGVAIKLVSEDGQRLEYAAVSGLPPEFFRERTLELARSPLNRRIIEGEPFALGDVSRRELFQFSENLAAAGVKSVLFVALTVEKRVIGILGAYADEEDRFGVDEVDFFRLAAGLAAVAMENARAFEAIEKLVKERSWFMMRVAHNLRAPLSAMQSIMNVLLEGLLGPLSEEQMSYLRRVSDRSQAMMRMVTELKTLAENRTGERGMTIEPVDMARVLGRIREMFEPEAAKKNILITFKVPSELPPVSGDPDLLHQMVENFVSNAIKYTPAGGRVSVEAAPVDGNLVMTFADTGIGIPRDSLPRLFTEFFRAENAKKVNEIGTGLGLAFVRDIISRHQGRVSVETEENKGTTFTVTLPVAGRRPLLP